MQKEPLETTQKKCPARVSPLMTNLSPLMKSLGVGKFELARVMTHENFVTTHEKRSVSLNFCDLNF